MSTLEENKATIKDFMSHLGTKNISALAGAMADDLEWIIPQDPKFSPLAGVRNKAEWAALYEGFISKMPTGVQYTIIGMTAEGDRVAVEAEAKADTPIGPFHNRYHFLFRLRNGLLIQAKEYADSLYMSMFAKGPAK